MKKPPEKLFVKVKKHKAHVRISGNYQWYIVKSKSFDSNTVFFKFSASFFPSSTDKICISNVLTTKINEITLFQKRLTLKKIK